MTTQYDLIIVGGGIAGLRVGIETLKKTPNIKCCILEKYGYIGGRITTFKKYIPKVGPVQWENGAGRISTSHKKVLNLLKEYNLSFIPIGSDTDFIKDSKDPDIVPDIVGNRFSDLIKIYLEPITKLSPETLATHTLKELLDRVIGPTSAKSFYEQFPYYSEIHTLRADLALESFRNEMKSNEGFGICPQGLSSLTDAMMYEFICRGGTVLMDTELYKVISNSDRTITLKCKMRGATKKMTFNSNAVVLALHCQALKGIKGINLPVLRHLTMMPLLRMYAIFPTKKGISWFSGLNKIVTNSPIRYIIPIDASRGIVMISYTDGQDAIKWIKENETVNKYGDENVEDLVMTDIRKLFLERTIPDPIFFKQHPWYDGCTYWRPGNYSVEEESNKSVYPSPDKMPHLFMCGESFAVHQCWMESALDQADKLLKNDAFINCVK